MDNDNSIAADTNEITEYTPKKICLLVLKWFLVVLDCLYVLALFATLVMGSNIAKDGLSQFTETQLRVFGAIELTIIIIGIIGWLSEQFLVMVFHCVSYTVYFVIMECADSNENFGILLFTIGWLIAAYYYTYQFRIQLIKIIANG